MANEEQELRTGQPAESVFRRLRRPLRTAAVGLVLIAIGLGSLVLPIFGTGPFDLLGPMLFFGVALVLSSFVLLIRNATARVACITVLLFLATELTVFQFFWAFAAAGPLIEGKSAGKVYENIHIGMTRLEVAALLGSPRSVTFEPSLARGYNGNKDSVECWRYYNKWQVLGDFVEVCFNPEGKVVDKYFGD